MRELDESTHIPLGQNGTVDLLKIKTTSYMSTNIRYVS